MKARFKKHILNFNIPGGTSRGILHQKTSYFLELKEGEKTGIGEVSILPNLSIDDDEKALEQRIKALCNDLEKDKSISFDYFKGFPSLSFAFETAILDLESGGKKSLFNTTFSRGEKGISINGLIWMGTKEFMLKQIEDKLNEGFKCLKLKIGAIDFETEIEILKSIRKRFSHESLELRVDANGAFVIKDAIKKLNRLHKFNIHSIEQPIKQGNWNEMSQLCRQTPFPIALDEELIGVDSNQIENLIETILPQFIILKPSLIGGLKISDKWIEVAEKRNIGWWLTSALEANVGLNAIAQFAATKSNKMPQGLGTGKVFSNNIESSLKVKKDQLWYNPETKWGNIFND